jgi:hypothetical protein
MATKSLAEKLFIKPNMTLWSSHASRLDLIQPLPENVRHVDRLEQATTALVFADNAGSLRDILNQHKEQRPSRAASGTPIPRPTEATSTATACGRSSVVRHAPHRAGVGGRGLVRDAPPHPQGRRGTLHGWPIAGSDGSRQCAGRMQRPYPTGGEQHGRA